MISMLLDENPAIELTDMDGTNLVRMLRASAKKAVGERIVPAMDNRKVYYNKAQKVLTSILCIICCLRYVSM
jgi:cohesin complex subunit SA-1/2